MSYVFVLFWSKLLDRQLLLLGPFVLPLLFSKAPSPKMYSSWSIEHLGSIGFALLIWFLFDFFFLLFTRFTFTSPLSFSRSNLFLPNQYHHLRAYVTAFFGCESFLLKSLILYHGPMIFLSLPILPLDDMKIIK